MGELLDELDNVKPSAASAAPIKAIKEASPSKEEVKEEAEARGAYNKKRKLEKISATEAEPIGSQSGVDRVKRRRLVEDDRQLVVLVGGKAKESNFKSIIQ